MEFPERILEVVLREEPEDIKVKVLRSLGRRPKISPTITECVASFWGENVSRSLKIAALRVVEHHTEALPKKLLQDVAALLKDPEGVIRAAAIRALGNQSALPEELLRDIAAMLKDPEGVVRDAALQALRNKSALPEELLRDIAAMLKNPEGVVRNAALQALGTKSVLTEELLQDIAAMLNDPEGDVRAVAVWALGNQSALLEERWYSFLLKLESQSFNT